MSRARSKVGKKGASAVVTGASSSADNDDDILFELLEDTFDLAVEENATENSETFVSFVTSYIPLEFLIKIALITTGNDDDDDVRPDEYLSSVWEERYGGDDNEEEDLDTARHPGSRVIGLYCKICERSVRLTRHHVYPRRMHKFCLKRSIASQEELQQTISVCRLCHATIHRFFTNEQLATKYNTVDALLSDDKFHAFANWNSRQHDKRNGRVK